MGCIQSNTSPKITKKSDSGPINDSFQPETRSKTEVEIAVLPDPIKSKKLKKSTTNLIVPSKTKRTSQSITEPFD